jgi:integrase
VDFVLGRIHVQRNWTHGRLGTPKSGRSRFIPMTQDLVAALQAHKHLKGKLIFSTREGDYLDRNKVKHPFWRCIRIAGVEEIGLHDMRHTFASQLAMKGVPLRAIQEMLGHASITTTQRYAHLSPSATADFVRVLEEGTNEFTARIAAHRPPTPRN